MPFSNNEIAEKAIPRAGDVALQPIDPRFLQVMIYNRLFVFILTYAAAGTLLYFIDKLHTTLAISLIVGAAIIFLAGNLVLGVLSFRNKSFAIREHDILYKTGWLVQSLHVCPFNRIQHCSIDSGLLERKFGLSKLHIYSAGADSSDISIQGMPTASAEAIRDMIIQKIAAE